MAKASWMASVVLLASLLASCGTAGVTPERLIENVKGMNNPDAIQKYEVNRPIGQVSAILRERASACLSRTVRTTIRDGYTTQTSITYYTPRTVIGKNRTRLTLQEGYDHPESMVGEGKTDKNGFYIIVVDAYPAGASKTRIESYSGRGDTAIFKAIRHWVDDTDSTCPNMAQ